MELSTFLGEWVKGALVRLSYGCYKLFLFQPGKVGGQEEEDDLPPTPKGQNYNSPGGNEEFLWQSLWGGTLQPAES